ncbi:MAG: PDZ domain-containing protein [Eubacterium sp.]|jgi:carboxyl-terminal processing protease|nr:PDZ domain-containing protein [Eubacterium sp.]
MNKKITLGLCISLVAICCTVTYVLSTTIALNTYNEKIAGIGEREAFYTKYQEIDSFVRNNFIGEIDENGLIVNVFDGYMTGISDKYAKYLTADEYYDFQQNESGSFITAGMITEPENGGYIKVTDVYENSSAAEIGIAAGDIITEVEGVSILESGVGKALNNLRGDEGTRLNITTLRDGVEAKHTLIRQRIDIVTVRGVVYGDVGYLRITGFNRLTDIQFLNLFDEMETAGVKGIIMDLRGTGGMLLTPVKNMLNRFIGNAALATAEDKFKNTTNIITTDGSTPSDLPIVALINKDTSNFAELFAAILRDFKNAQIVGTASAGDATMTKTQVLRDGSAITISIAKVKSAASAGFDGTGIQPDFIVDMTAPVETDITNIENTNDTQLKKAFDILGSLKQP